MQVLINLEKDGVEDLRKAIDVLTVVIGNKENGRHFSEGLDRFDAPSEQQQETQATLDQVSESHSEVGSENNSEVHEISEPEPVQEAPQEEQHHEENNHEQHHEEQHNPEPVQEAPAEQQQQQEASKPDSMADQKKQEQEKLMEEVDLSKMFLSKLTIKPLK